MTGKSSLAPPNLREAPAARRTAVHDPGSVAVKKAPFEPAGSARSSHVTRHGNPLTIQMASRAYTSTCVEPFVYPALQLLFLGAFVLLVLKLSHVFGFVRDVRIALLFGSLFLAAIVVERNVNHPGREAILTASLAFLLLVAAHVILQLADHVIWEQLLKPRHISAPRLLFDIFNFLVLAGVGLAILKTLYAVNLTGLLVTSTVVSAIIGLSLQDVLTSVMSGIALQLEGPFSVMDWVKVGDEEGQVVQMNWRTVTLRSRDSHYVVLPNARIAKEDVTNYSRPDPLEQIHATVGIAYSHAPGDVRRVIEQAIRNAEGVEDSPTVQVLVKEFADSAIQYDIRFFTRDFARVPQIRDRVLTHTWYALNRAGFSIPFPQREVLLRNAPDRNNDQQMERMRGENSRVLRSVTTFRPLSDNEIEVLARSARMERFAAGEYLVRQGEQGRSLFVIKEGTVRIAKTDATGVTLDVAKLGPGDFFGEMSLLTGEPRSASVLAVTEVEVTVVDKDAVAEVIVKDRQLVQALSMALESRSRELARSGTRSETSLAASPDSGTFLGRIQRFFGIES